MPQSAAARAVHEDDLPLLRQEGNPRSHDFNSATLVTVVATLGEGYGPDSIWRQVDRGPAKDAWPSGPVDFEAAAHSSSDGLQVVLVGTDHKVVSAEGAFNHACVHDVGSRGASGERAD
jgi:hypothetical protein